mgnify:FL=1
MGIPLEECQGDLDRDIDPRNLIQMTYFYQTIGNSKILVSLIMIIYSLKHNINSSVV